MKAVPETRWQHLGSTTDEEDGRLTVSCHVVEMHSGEEFTISVTGRGEAPGSLFLGSVMVFAETMKTQLGADRLPTTRHVPKLRTN